MATEFLDKLSPSERQQLNQWAGFFGHIPNWAFVQFLLSDEKVICLFTGNQYGKTDGIAQSYVMRILGIHPVEAKNMRPWKQVRTYRFASETLPTDTESEVKNTQYPAFKRRLPPHLIKKDITIRNPSMVLHDPQGGDDITIDFVSYNQEVKSQAGVQRAGVWLDEHCKKTFYQEQLPRLLRASEESGEGGGDIVYSLTAALEMVNWEYDELFGEARKIVRTQDVCNRYRDRFKKNYKPIEINEKGKSIAVIQAATDDNPTLSRGTIDDMFATLDPDMEDVRRYGIFRAITGTIFKSFASATHVIDGDQYFEYGLPSNWRYGRAIDYHEHNPWAISFLALSPENELFVFDELYPSPDNMITYDIAKEINSKSKEFRSSLDLIDPLAQKNQPNTGTTTVDDLNKFAREFYREGEGTGAFWQSWDTKSTRGREEIRARLKGSLIATRPFNNKVNRGGKEIYLPTIWFFRGCRHHIEAMKNWRIEQWQSQEHLVTKEKKDKPQQKWSHFPMCLEAMLKHPGFAPSSRHLFEREVPKFFQGRRQSA